MENYINFVKMYPLQSSFIQFAILGFFGEFISFLYSFSLSTLTNIFFGPQMMLFHRFEENIIMAKKDFKGIEFSILSLLWFWISAHTITFLLPKDFQMGMSVLWSVVFGIILSVKR